MDWTKKLPREPGIYFTYLKRIMRQDVIRINDVLYVQRYGNSVELLKWKDAEKYWWLGPLPALPKEH